MFRQTHKAVDARFLEIAFKDGWGTAVTSLKRAAQNLLNERTGVKGTLSEENYFKAGDVDTINILDAATLMDEWRKVKP